MLHIVLHVVRVVNNKVASKTLQKYNKLRSQSSQQHNSCIIPNLPNLFQSQQNVINK